MAFKWDSLVWIGLFIVAISMVVLGVTQDPEAIPYVKRMVVLGICLIIIGVGGWIFSK